MSYQRQTTLLSRTNIKNELGLRRIILCHKVRWVAFDHSEQEAIGNSETLELAGDVLY